MLVGNGGNWFPLCDDTINLIQISVGGEEIIINSWKKKSHDLYNLKILHAQKHARVHSEIKHWIGKSGLDVHNFNW